MSRLRAEAQRRAVSMRELSEEGFYAGWMHGLEFDLWEALMGGARVYGHLELTDVHLQQLRQLSEACGGWVVFAEGARALTRRAG